jgi:glycosyltransferase involved in cell wall biosynthesis
MIKVLNITFTTRWGGLEQVFLDYLEALKDVEIIPVVHNKSEIIPYLKGKFYKLTNFSKHDPITLFRLKRIIAKEKPDFIITHGNRAHYLAKKASASFTKVDTREFSRTKIIGVAHGYSFDHIKNCDYIFAVSNDIKNALVKIGYPKNKIYHIPNMIRLNSKLNLEFGISNVPTIGVIARIEKEKGMDVFIKAVNILNQQGVSVKAIIAGVGSELENIKKLIKELSLEEEIELVGFASDKAEFYRNIDILCVPSLMEPFGIVILEGFLYGKPVIASDASGPVEIIEDKIDGFITPKGDYQELANSIKYLLDNSDIIPTIRQKAFEKVKLYDMNVAGAKITKILEAILY